MNDTKAWEVDTLRGHFNNVSRRVLLDVFFLDVSRPLKQQCKRRLRGKVSFWIQLGFQ